MQYAINTQNPEKADNETNIYRNPSTNNKTLKSFMKCSTLH